MPFDLNGYPLATATITLPAQGVWCADVSLVEPQTLAVGARVTLRVGDVVLVGAVRPSSGTFFSQTRLDIVGGAGGWEQLVDEQPYADREVGVPLSQAAGDLAAAVGETLAPLEAGTDRVLGAGWSRPAGLASSALRDLVGEAWYVGIDGVTYLQLRPVATAPAAGDVRVERWDPTTGRALLSAEDDGLSRFLPGSIVASPLLPAPLPITETTLRATASSVCAEVLFTVHPLVKLVADIVKAIMRHTVFLGLYVYEVLGDSTAASDAHDLLEGSAPAGRVSLRNVSGVKGLPDVLDADKAHGLPGAWSTLAEGTLALVGFREGDPAQGYVALYLPAQPLPLEVGVDAAQHVVAGAYNNAYPVSNAAKVDANTGILRVALNAALAALSLTPVGTLQATATTKFRAE